MANSGFWRELAISFKSVPEFYEFTAYRHYYMELRYFLPTSVLEPDWKLQAIPPALAEFDAMARRGAAMLAPPPTGDLAVAWLEALWKEATEGPVRSGIPIVGKDRSGRLTELRGTIPRVFEASSTLCRKFESAAAQAEFEENKRNDPRNWSPLRANFETFRAIKELHARPPERIPESLVRRTIADQLGIKPEEVTPKQINFAISGLFPAYGSVELIPDSQPQNSSDAPANEQSTNNEHSTPTPLSEPEETIAAQLQRLRLESNWTIEKLAGKQASMRRQLSGISLVGQSHA